MSSIGSGTTATFLREEFHTITFKDKRLKERFINIMDALSKKLTSCIRRAIINENDARQAYDFFQNEKVDHQDIFECHAKQTAQRVKESPDVVLLIQDGMRLNFTSHTAKTDIGRISKSNGKDIYGIIQHSSLCVTENNEPLGLIDVQFFDYDQVDTSASSFKRPIENKANMCWIKAFENARALIGTEKKVITVADREGDFFEFLHVLTKKNADFVIRAKSNRNLEKDLKDEDNAQKLNDTLQDSFARASSFGTTKIEIQNVETRCVEEISLQLKALTVTLPVPKKLKSYKEKQYGSITLNAIKAYNENYEWTLLTSLPIQTLQDIEKILHIYKARWHIEDFHKVLKTGYQVDEIFLHSCAEAIKTLLVMAIISALRLYWLIYKGRVSPEIRADELFTEFEWKSTYVYLKKPIPDMPPTLQEVIFNIAMMGGFKNKKKYGPPGIKTMWIGFSHMNVAAQTLENFIFMSTKT
jgi:hypothetical protein